MRNLLKLKKFSVLIIPEKTSSEPKAVKISSVRLMIYIGIYSLVVFFLGFYLISFTPLSEILFPYSLRLTDSDKKKVEILNDKVNLLVAEIESLKSVNERLKFAIMLGDSNIFKDAPSKDYKKKSTDSVITKSKFEGSILSVLKAFFYKYLINQNEGIYFIKPADGFISKEFSYEKGHFGLDFVMKENSSVYASAGGYVVFSDYTPKYGYTIILNHSGNYVTKYMHCSALVKKTGDKVLQGEIIALSGNSGTDSSGPHLHFEIWKNGSPINPSNVLINY